MKHIKTFEQFINESNDFVNEGAGDREVAALAMKVADGLKKDAKKEKDSEMIKTYNDDAKDWVALSDLAKSDIKKAMKKYRRLDTASQEYLADYLNKKDAAKLADAFGMSLREEESSKLEEGELGKTFNGHVDWPKMHDDIIYDLEQILDRCYKFEDVISGKVKTSELNKAKNAHKKLDDAIKAIINSL
jgi:hypothetical protein